ncbi:MAG TPA: helix-turn-helix domain-containing protein [Thermoguttaceae bacterium]|nr:helix-turn-helix domain-containing protein [Thermoguttaceae bacterium]
MATIDRPASRQGRYMDLVCQFPLRPIRSKAALDRATTMIDRLLDKDHLTAAERDYLDVLSGLVEEYESKEFPIEPLPDAQMLRQLIDARGVSQTEVARATGIVDSTISAVLKGKRSLNRDHVGRLARFFHVSPDVFAF